MKILNKEMPSDPLIVSEGEFKAMEMRLATANEMCKTYFKALQFIQKLKQTEWEINSINVASSYNFQIPPSIEIQLITVSKKTKELFDEWKKLINEFDIHAS